MLPGKGAIQHVVDEIATPGDTIVLEDGVYFESLHLPPGDWTIRAGRTGGTVVDGVWEMTRSSSPARGTSSWMAS